MSFITLAVFLSLILVPSKANALNCENIRNNDTGMIIPGENTFGQWINIPVSSYANADCPVGTQAGICNDESGDIFILPNGSQVTTVGQKCTWPIDRTKADITCYVGSTCPNQFKRPALVSPILTSISPSIASYSSWVTITGSNLVDAANTASIELSQDGGATWKRLNNAFMSTSPTQLIFSPFPQTALFSIGRYSLRVWNSRYGASAASPFTINPNSLSNLTATPNTAPPSITLSWSPESTVGFYSVPFTTVSLTSYKVERSTSSTTGFTEIASVDPSLTNYIDNITPSQTLFYRARALISNGMYTGYTNVVSVLPSPTITSLNPVNSQPGSNLTITGTNFTTTGNTVNLLNSTSSVIVWTQTNISSANATTITITIPTTIQTGAYNVQVSNANGTSNALPINIGSPSPSNLVATMGSLSDIGKVSLTWTDNSSNETGYQIERATDASSSAFTLLTTVPASANSYTDDLNSVTFDSSTEAYRIRGAFAGGTFSDYSNIAKVSNCVKMQGNGPFKVVFIRSSGENDDVMTTALDPLSNFLNYTNHAVSTFLSIDPMKTYANSFSFYADIKPTVYRGNVPSETSCNAPDTGVSFAKVESNDHHTEYAYANANPTIPRLTGFTINNRSWFSVSLPDPLHPYTINGVPESVDENYNATVHEFGHSFAGLDDEYRCSHIDNSDEDGQRYSNVFDCSQNPDLDYWDSVDNRTYGSINTLAVSRSPDDEERDFYIPSRNSMMNVISTSTEERILIEEETSVGTQEFQETVYSFTRSPEIRFNVISCGYIMARLMNEPVDKAHAQTHWPQCMTMNTVKEGIPDRNPIIPSISGVSVNIITPGSTLAVSAVSKPLPDAIPFPTNGNIFNDIGYYLTKFSKQMIAAVAGAPSSITGSGFTPTDNAVEIFNSATSTDIVGLTSNGNTLTFTVPANLPPGSYSLKVGAFNSDWSSSVPITVTAAPVNQTPSITLTTSSYFIAYGGRATLTWTPTNATNCIGSGGTGNADDNWNGAKASSNGSHSQSTGILTNATAYTISCSGSGGNIAASVQIYVTGHPTPTVTSFTVLPTSVASGGNVTLSWVAQNASSCWGAGMGPAKTFPTTYSVVRNPTTTTVYTLICTNATGIPSATSTVTVTIIPTKMPSVPATTVAVPAISIPNTSVPTVQTYTTPNVSPTARPSPTPSASPSASPSPSPSPTTNVSPTIKPSLTPTPISTPKPTSTPTPTIKPSPTPTSTSRPSPTPTASTLNMTSAIWDAIRAMERFFGGQW